MSFVFSSSIAGFRFCIVNSIGHISKIIMASKKLGLSLKDSYDLGK